MPESPDGYQPYKRSSFPPRIFVYFTHTVSVISVIVAIIFYHPVPRVPFLIAALSGLVANLYLHESIHYVIDLLLGYEPVFSWPNRVYVPNVPLSVKEGVISLAAPQVLTVIYAGLLYLSHIKAIDFLIVIALIANVVGGFKDVAWIIRRLTWPKGNLVLVDSNEREFFTFPE